jgi:hypothetical protein
MKYRVKNFYDSGGLSGEEINEWLISNDDKIEIIDIKHSSADDGVDTEVYIYYKLVGRKEKLEKLDSLED